MLTSSVGSMYIVTIHEIHPKYSLIWGEVG